MKLSKRVINLIFGISLSILLLLIVFVYSRLTTFKTYANFVSHSLAVQNDILAMKSSYRALIADQRSYLITKEDSYFDSFQDEKDSLRHTVDHFKKLTRDNKIHQSYITRIEDNVNNRIQSLLVEVINDSSSARYKFAQQELIARNTELNSDFSKTVTALYNYEKQLMNQQLEAKKSEERLTPFLLLLTALATISILAYSFILILRELQRRQLTEEALKDNIEDLNRSNKELEQYAYVASHDLQEPLRKIRTFGDRLQQKYGSILPSDGQDMLTRIDKSSQRMTLLIEDLLSLSRLLSVKPDFKLVDLKKALEDVLSTFSEALESKNAEVVTGKLPTITAAEGQIGQLFQNLIGNAIKFSSDERPLRISVNASVVSKWEEDQEFKYHQVTIRDNGVGFDNAYLEKMFAIFGRLQHTKHVKGTGIGLSICNRIMQNHGGLLNAEGKKGEGAVFFLLFPLLTP